MSQSVSPVQLFQPAAGTLATVSGLTSDSSAIASNFASFLQGSQAAPIQPVQSGMVAVNAIDSAVQPMAATVSSPISISASIDADSVITGDMLSLSLPVAGKDFSAPILLPSAKTTGAIAAGAGLKRTGMGPAMTAKAAFAEGSTAAPLTGVQTAEVGTTAAPQAGSGDKLTLLAHLQQAKANSPETGQPLDPLRVAGDAAAGTAAVAATLVTVAIAAPVLKTETISAQPKGEQSGRDPAEISAPHVANALAKRLATEARDFTVQNGRQPIADEALAIPASTETTTPLDTLEAPKSAKDQATSEDAAAGLAGRLVGGAATLGGPNTGADNAGSVVATSVTAAATTAASATSDTAPVPVSAGKPAAMINLNPNAPQSAPEQSRPQASAPQATAPQATAPQATAPQATVVTSEDAARASSEVLLANAAQKSDQIVSAAPDETARAARTTDPLLSQPRLIQTQGAATPTDQAKALHALASATKTADIAPEIGQDLAALANAKRQNPATQAVQPAADQTQSTASLDRTVKTITAAPPKIGQPTANDPAAELLATAAPASARAQVQVLAENPRQAAVPGNPVPANSVPVNPVSANVSPVSSTLPNAALQNAALPNAASPNAALPNTTLPNAAVAGNVAPDPLNQTQDLQRVDAATVTPKPGAQPSVHTATSQISERAAPANNAANPSATPQVAGAASAAQAPEIVSPKAAAQAMGVQVVRNSQPAAPAATLSRSARGSNAEAPKTSSPEAAAGLDPVADDLALSADTSEFSFDLKPRIAQPGSAQAILQSAQSVVTSEPSDAVSAVQTAGVTPPHMAPQPPTGLNDVAATTQVATSGHTANAQRHLAMNDPDWPGKLTSMLNEARDLTQGEIEIALQPERLGKMTVKLEIRDNTVSVTIVTESETSARLLNDNQGRLSELMAKSGLDLTQHSAGTGQFSRDAGGQAGQNANAQTGQNRSGQSGNPGQQEQGSDQHPSQNTNSSPADDTGIDIIA